MSEKECIKLPDNRDVPAKIRDILSRFSCADQVKTLSVDFFCEGLSKEALVELQHISFKLQFRFSEQQELFRKELNNFCSHPRATLDMVIQTPGTRRLYPGSFELENGEIVNVDVRSSDKSDMAKILNDLSVIPFFGIACDIFLAQCNAEQLAKIESMSDEFKTRLASGLALGGYAIGDADAFLNDIENRFKKPSVDQVIAEEFSLIMQADPQLFLRNQINLQDVAGRIRELYTHDQELLLKHGGPEKIEDWVSYSFKVSFRHVRFFLIDCPDDEELRGEIDNIKEILNGEFFKNKEDVGKEGVMQIVDADFLSKIPNVFNLKEDSSNYFLTFELTKDTVRRVLPFLVDSEIQKISMQVFSEQGINQRILQAKEIIERYLNQCRMLFIDENPIPEFYDTEHWVYKAIQKYKKSIVI